MNYGLWSYLGENRLHIDRIDESTKDYGLQTEWNGFFKGGVTPGGLRTVTW
jgi:hypothetical protein